MEMMNVKNKNKVCAVSGCQSVALCKLMCKLHYGRVRNNGVTHRITNHVNPAKSYSGEYNKYSNKRITYGGRWVSPDEYICKDCGVVLSNDNAYKNWEKNKSFLCKECSRIRSRNRNRKHHLNSGEGVFTLKKKIPEHPGTNICMLCNREQKRRTGLAFHHWYIDKTEKIAYGLWLCCVCHMFAERRDHGFTDKYDKLKEKYLIVGKKL